MTALQIRAAMKRPYFIAGLLVLAILAISVVTRGAINAKVSPALLRDWRYITGSVLIAMYAFQWTLFIARRSGDARQVRFHYWLHKICGVALLSLFVLHAGAIGYGLMGFVAIALVVIAVTGLFNAEVLLLASEKWRWARLMIHYTLAALIGPLLVLHIWTALSHK
jgi:hypothetical protein